MSKTINVPPPSDFVSFSPSELFRYFFQIGHWTEDSFSDEFQNFTHGKLVSTVSINKWKNRDVIPTRYAGSFFKLINTLATPEIAVKWIEAFETVWARHSSRKAHKKVQPHSENLSDNISEQHQRWIVEQYNQPLNQNKFSASDIYIPLQFSDTETSDIAAQDVEDILDLLNEPGGSTGNIDWAFIFGGPGSGKSMTALHLATTLCGTDVFPIYIRGRRISNIDIDIADPKTSIEDVFSIKSFLAHFRTSSYDEAYLILDGLDEINHGPQGSSQTLARLISELEIERTACAAHNKTLKVIAFGRAAHVKFSANQLSKHKSKCFECLTLDGRLRQQNTSPESFYGQDLRPQWWKAYLAATDQPFDPSLPDFLATEFDDFSEFGSDPLLTYLICQTALTENGVKPSKDLPHERVNRLTYSVNKNEIYSAIMSQLALRHKSALNKTLFISVLQHIALAQWHAEDNTSVSQEAVFANIKDPTIKSAFQALALTDVNTHATTDLLIAVFYERLSQDENQSLIEFTHKTFSDYLTATLIFDSFQNLVSSMGKPAAFTNALKDWAALSCKGSHTASLADFCQKEAALRFENISNFNWEAVLELIQEQVQGGPNAWPTPSSITASQRSSSLLFFIWSCFNLERQKHSDEPFSLSENAQNFTMAHLKSIQIPNPLSFESGSLMEPLLRNMTFLTYSLSALHLVSEDMSQVCLSLGHIETLTCTDSSFAMTYWSHVKLTNSTFSRSVFQQAIFHQWRVYDTHFSNCFFQGSRFQGALISDCYFDDTVFSQCHFSDVEFTRSNLKNVVFDRCVFTDCAFENMGDAKFRHSTFLDMKAGFETIAVENFENSIPQGNLRNGASKSEDNKFQIKLTDLL